MTEETKAEKRKRIERRNRYRNTVCCGCRHNYYNFPRANDGVNVGVSEDYSCWSIMRIFRGKCPHWSR
jgi:hypothetical protein